MKLVKVPSSALRNHLLYLVPVARRWPRHTAASPWSPPSASPSEVGTSWPCCPGSRRPPPGWGWRSTWTCPSCLSSWGPPSLLRRRHLVLETLETLGAGVSCAVHWPAARWLGDCPVPYKSTIPSVQVLRLRLLAAHFTRKLQAFLFIRWGELCQLSLSFKSVIYLNIWNIKNCIFKKSSTIQMITTQIK